MSLATMIAEARGTVPNYSALLARKHIREAWTDIRKMKGWSFQLCNGGFATPGLVNQGSATTTLGSPTVTGDATASAAWAVSSTAISLITQRQFRVGASTIYNIIAADFTIPTAAVLTLDRPWIDRFSGSGQGYSIYQCYYPVPVQDFAAWESVVDVNNAIDLCAGTAKKYVDQANNYDPQRQIFSNPGSIIPYQVDARPGSATLGWMMYELYPQPQTQYAYSTWYSRDGADLVNPTDTAPFPITEHLIKTLARVKAYEWAEANKNAANPRGAGADFRFLMGAAAKEAAAMLKEIRMEDRDRVDMYYSVMSRVMGTGYPALFNPATGMVSANNTQ
jgi:hypothetical protein